MNRGKTKAVIFIHPSTPPKRPVNKLGLPPSRKYKHPNFVNTVEGHNFIFFYVVTPIWWTNLWTFLSKEKFQKKSPIAGNCLEYIHCKRRVVLCPGTCRKKSKMGAQGTWTHSWAACLGCFEVLHLWQNGAGQIAI